MPNIRMSRINGEIQKAVGYIIDNNLRSSELKNALVSVQSVDTTPDLILSKIYVSSLGVPTADVVSFLNSSKGYIKKELAKKIRIKTLPDLLFVADTTIAYKQHMDKLFDQIKRSDS